MFIEHAKKLHHHLAHHSKNIIIKAAEKHPIVVTGLALFGAWVGFEKLTAKPTAGVQNTGVTL